MVVYFIKIEESGQFLLLLQKVRVFLKNASYIGCVDHGESLYGRHTRYKSEIIKKHVF